MFAFSTAGAIEPAGPLSLFHVRPLLPPAAMCLLNSSRSESFCGGLFIFHVPWEQDREPSAFVCSLIECCDLKFSKASLIGFQRRNSLSCEVARVQVWSVTMSR